MYSSDPLLKFVFDENLKKDICKCKEGFYDDSRYEYYGSDSMCRSCSDKIYNCKKCHDENEK